MTETVQKYNDISISYTTTTDMLADLHTKRFPEPHKWFDAITMNNNLAYIDYEKCKLCRKCVVECPTKAIHELNFPPRKEKKAPADKPAKPAPKPVAEKPVEKEEEPKAEKE